MTLLDLLRSRAAQKNLQLIIITHDEEFVEMLLREQVVEHYYKVSKGDDGYSRLEECHDINELRD